MEGAYKRFPIGIGSHSHGGTEVPWLAVCMVGLRRVTGITQSTTEGLGPRVLVG